MEKSASRNIHPVLQDRSIALLLASSAAITAFLFFIDEGYYNFHWMWNFGNWIVFGIYTFAIFMAQFLVSLLLVRKNFTALRTTATILLGAAIGIFTLVVFVF